MKYGRKNLKFNPERLSKYNIDRQSTALIPDRSRVMEIGCATGFMGEYLIKKKKCEVYGIELGKGESEEAKKKLTDVICGDVEEKQTISKVKKLGKFDIVFATALIEHLKDPWQALRMWKTFLKPGGHIIISTSNIAHWSVRIKILKGRFEYEDFGIFDNTHLHFFTINTFKQLVQDCGYAIEYFGIDAEGGGMPRLSLLGSKLFPNLFAYQMVIKARER